MFGRGIGPPEIILIVLVIVLLFGAKKLPETARGLGRSLRIFRAETKGMKDDDKADSTDVDAASPRQVEARREAPAATPPGSDTVHEPAGESVPDPSRRDI